MSVSRPSYTRLIIRQTSELVIARSARWRDLFAIDPMADYVLQIVLSASIAHLPLRHGGGWFLTISDAAALGRPINATAVARSMWFAHTTVRRRAAALVDAGLLVREPAGFRMTPALLTGSAMRAAMAANRADLTAMLTALTDRAYQPAVRAIALGVPRLPPGLVERLLLAFTLRVLENVITLYGDVTKGALMSTIIAANIHHITNDPYLSRRYAGEDTLPPDGERRPVTIRAVARAAGIPFETTRRHVADLIAAGQVRATPDGVFVPGAVLGSASFATNNRRIVEHFEQMLEALMALAATDREAPSELTA